MMFTGISGILRLGTLICPFKIGLAMLPVIPIFPENVILDLSNIGTIIVEGAVVV